MSEVERQRTRVTVGEDRVLDTSSTDYPQGPLDVARGFNMNDFKEKFKVEVINLTDNEAEFDLIGVDAAVANTLRRILIAEVPTIAIESCFIYNNTSIMHDEILAHRLGLVPIKADPRVFDFVGDDGVLSEDNHLKFKLNVKCTKNPDAKPDATDPKELYINSNVMSGDLEWIPQGNQRAEHGDIAPVHPDILLTKLRPGQEVDIEMNCVKGIGKEHAKWSPVGTASYRLLPEIVLLRPYVGEQATQLQAVFGQGVIEVEKGADGIDVAKVANARAYNMNREVHRHPELADGVRLQRVRDHFIFSVESTGALPAVELVKYSMAVLQEKVKHVQDKLVQHQEGGDDDDDDDDDDGEGGGGAADADDGE